VPQFEFPNRAQFTALAPVYPVFQREHLRAKTAPLKTVERFVSPNIVTW
jgi:hypothetical protein